MIGCSLCGIPSICRVALNAGCAAFPDDREQELCAQHARSIEPVDECDVIIVRNAKALALVRGEPL